jgi:hypothetical protein
MEMILSAEVSHPPVLPRRLVAAGPVAIAGAINDPGRRNVPRVSAAALG